jgi:hypothetical protein
VCRAVISVGSGAIIGRFDCLADYVRFSNPRSLGIGEDYGDDMAGCLEILDEGVDIRGGLRGRRSVVIYYLCIGLTSSGTLMNNRLIQLTRMCILTCTR